MHRNFERDFPSLSWKKRRKRKKRAVWGKMYVSKMSDQSKVKLGGNKTKLKWRTQEGCFTDTRLWGVCGVSLNNVNHSHWKSECNSNHFGSFFPLRFEIDAPGLHASVPGGIHYAQAEKEKNPQIINSQEKTRRKKKYLYLNYLAAPHLYLPDTLIPNAHIWSDFLFFLLFFFFFFFFFIQKSSNQTSRFCWKCSQKSTAPGGDLDAFDGTAASRIVPVKHAPPT